MSIMDDIKKSAEAVRQLPSVVPFAIPEIDADMLVKPQARLHPDDLKTLAAMTKSAKELDAREAYPLPEGASWEKLKIKFIDGHTVKVRYPGIKTATFDYKDMGFADRKKNGSDMKWEFLRGLAERGGSWMVSDFRKENHRTTKYETAKRLRAFFGMASDPFHAYEKKGGYRIKCLLYPDTGGDDSNEEA